LGAIAVAVGCWIDGGIIGLDLAMHHHPNRIRRVVAIGANFTPDGLINLARPGDNYSTASGLPFATVQARGTRPDGFAR
jgi:hypothetical protein